MIKGAGVLILFCASIAAQDSGLAGTTVDASTGRPLAGVHVVLLTIGGSGAPTVYGAMSDSAGRFSIAKMPAGSYFYYAERAGYVTLQKGPRAGGAPPALALKAGAPISDFKIEVTPRATISGRVLDEFGDPVQSVEMRATPVSPDAPAAFEMMGSNTFTDDRGEFRLSLAPGRYTVKATPQATGPQRTAEIRTDGTAPPIYTATYYPSAAAAERATPVDVAAGAEAKIEIRLARPARGAPAEIAGVVLGIPEKGGQAMVRLDSGETAERLFRSQSSSVDRDGRFHFGTLQPGHYRLSATYTDGSGAQLRSQAIQFQDSNAPAHVELSLRPGEEITGTFEMPGGGPEKRVVYLQPPPPAWDFASGAIDAEGAFRVPNIFPGKYKVTVRPLPDDAYVKSVELDGKTIPDGDLDWSRGAPGSRLKIVASRKAAQITGSVLDQDGTKIGSTMAIVLLARDLKKIQIDDERQTARVMGTGTYSLKGIAPGKYFLLAIDVFRSGNIGDIEQLQKFAGSAVEIEVKEGDRITKDVKFAVEDANAKPKQ